MGRGSSGMPSGRANADQAFHSGTGARAAKTSYGYEYIGEGATHATAANVARINEIRAEDGSRKYISNALDDISPGQSVSIYSTDTSAAAVSYMSVADDLVVWTKRDDGTWSGSNGQRRETSDMTREIYNSRRSLSPGRINTDSYENVDGRHRTYAGMSFQEGTFDSLMNVDGRPMKYSHKGLITEYNGNRYGVIKNTSGQSGKAYYSTIHMGTGLGIGSSTNSYKEAVAQIKEVDVRLRDFKDLKGAEKRFANTIRGD